jgi:outer membrane protein assembly factor BamB
VQRFEDCFLCFRITLHLLIIIYTDMKAKFFLTALVAMCISASQMISAQDWPQLYGPTRDSKSIEKNLLRSWPAAGPEVLWTAPLGAGFGGPVVKAGKVYILDRDDTTGDIMRCFDLNTGKELWKVSYNSPGEVPFPGSRSIPIVDDKHVYSVGMNGDLYCIDINTHQPVWHKNVWKDYGGGKVPMWGIAQSPAIYGDLLLVNSQAPEAGIVAYNKNTGAVVWKTPNLGNESYVSPKILKIHGEDHVVMVTSSTNDYTHPNKPKTKGTVVGLDPKTGKELWKFADWECAISISNAVLAPDNKLLIVGGYDRGATMIQVNKDASGKFSTKELFTTLEFGDQTKDPLYLDGHFYAMYRTNQKSDGFACLDMNGNVVWKT